MSNFSPNLPAGARKDQIKPAHRLASFFGKPSLRSQSEPGGPSSIRRAQNPIKPPDLMPQGKAINVGTKGKPQPATGNVKYDIAKLAANETDERYQYLLKRAIIRRVEDDDKIIYAELPGLPGVLVVYRKPSERNVNPERLNLDKRELTQMPLLEGEERLRLLNFQHNFITKIENLLSLPNLIFLDLYNNQIKEISSLHTVPTLRVLMLGKNLIDKIKNLQALTKLDVLDLHSNKISKIENISHLAELRVLNLANNHIETVENLDGLVSLTEINLRRNFISIIKGLENLSKLQRVFLSNNKIDRFENVNCLAGCSQLTELALDNNGIQLNPQYTNFILNLCPNLKHLDLKKITSDMKNDQAKSTPSEPAQTEDTDIPPENLISVILQEWKAEIERIKSQGSIIQKNRKETPADSLVQSGHAEIEGDSMLFIYGNALEVLGKQEFQDTVDQIFCQYIRFEYIVQHSVIHKLKKFGKLQKLIFNENNLHSFIQLSKLECLPTVTSITIENNDVSQTVLCRSFIVYRFPNVNLINGTEVTDTDRSKARQQFQNFDKILCSPNLMKPPNDLEDREAQKAYRLASKKHTEFAQGYIKNLLSYAISTETKLKTLNSNWDGLVTEIIKKTTRELSIPSSISEDTLKGVFIANNNIQE